MAAAPCRWVATPAARTHTSFRLPACGCSVDQQLRRGPSLFTREDWEGGGLWPNSPTAEAEAVLVRSSSTLFDALIPPKSTVPTHPR
jgi:hypothetical protein